MVVGGLDDAFPAFVRRGWRPTEEKWSGSVWQDGDIRAVAGERYPYAPVSDLYMFGRAQDLALQKARDNIHQRNHLRLWLSPMRYHGKQVWVGQISRDIGSRLTIHSPTLTTHKIDPDVDEARARWREDMAYSQNLAKIGCVKGVGAAPQERPARQPHDRPLLHRRVSRRARVRPQADLAGGDRASSRGRRASMTRVAAMRVLRVVRNAARCALALAGCATWQAPADFSDARVAQPRA